MTGNNIENTMTLFPSWTIKGTKCNDKNKQSKREKEKREKELK